MGKSPEGGPKVAVTNEERSGSVSSKGSESKVADTDEELLDYDGEDKEDDQKKQEELVRMEEEAQKVLEEQSQSEGTNDDNSSGQN